MRNHLESGTSRPASVRNSAPAAGIIASLILLALANVSGCIVAGFGGPDDTLAPPVMTLPPEVPPEDPPEDPPEELPNPAKSVPELCTIIDDDGFIARTDIVVVAGSDQATTTLYNCSDSVGILTVDCCVGPGSLERRVDDGSWEVVWPAIDCDCAENEYLQLEPWSATSFQADPWDVELCGFVDGATYRWTYAIGIEGAAVMEMEVTGNDFDFHCGV